MKNNLLKVFTVLFAALLTGMSVKADEITYNGTETFYFDKASNSGWGHLDAPDADVYLEFANNGNNKTKSSPAQWEKQDEILKVTVPSGTYNQVRIVRGPKGNPGSVWNEFDWITLQTGKNQILNGGGLATYGSGGGDEPTTFTKGSTLYFDMNGQDWTGGHYGAIFYTSTMHNINGNDDGYWDDEHISQRGSKYTISDKSTKLTEVGNGVYSLTIPYDNATTVRVCRFSKESDTQGYLKSCSKRLAAKDLGTNNCLKLLAGGKEGTWNLNAEWSTYSEPTPALTDEFYIFGDGGCADWVKGWSGNKGKAEYKMTVNGSVASITFYNMKKQNGYLFKVWNKTKNTELTWAAYDGSKSTDITCTNPSGSNNISFNLDANADITVYTDGTNVWAKAEKHQTISSDYYLKGDFEGWNGNDWTSNHFTKVDDYTQTYTIRFTKTQAVKAFTSGWGNEINYQNIHEATCINYTKSTPEDNQIGINLTKPSDVTFTLWKDKGGNRKISIKVVEEAPAEKVTVTFMANGEVFDTQTIEKGSKPTKPATNPTKEGFKFLGWSETDGGDVVDVTTITINENKSFYAKWGNGVSVTFDSNYGSAVEEQVVEKGGKATKPTDPTKSENEFKGWYQNADFSGDPFNFDNTTIEEDITLYAKWNYNGTTYMVNGSNLGITPWNSDDWDANMEKMPEMTKVDDHLEYKVQVAFLKGNDIRFKLLPCRTHYAASHECWDNGRGWDTYFSKERSSNLATYEPHGDNNIKVNLDGEGAYGITICYDGVNVYMKVEPLTLYTVTFMNGTTEYTTQGVYAGFYPTKPTPDPEKAGYTFLGWSETEGGDVVDVTTITILDAKTFYAKWEKKSIESLTLSQEEGKIFVEGSDLTLIATVTPEDVLLASTEWISTDDNIATVTDGVVHPVAVGEVTITCTVTDENGNVLTATCAITVRPEDEDCEMVRTDVYAATITSDEDKDKAEVTGGTLTVKDMYHITGEPFTMLFVKEGSYTSSNPYGVDNGSGVLMGDDNPSNGIENWIRIKCGQKNGKDVYYIQNATTKKYLAITGDRIGQNGDWYYYVTTLTNAIEDTDMYKWLFLQDGSGRMNVINAIDFGGGTSDNDLKYYYHLHTNNWLEPNSYAQCAPKAIVCGRSCDMGRNCVRPKSVTIITTPLPDYKSTSVTVDDVTYYRMTEETVITADITTSIARGNRVQIALYNDGETAATAVVKDKDGNTIATIEVPSKQTSATDYEAKDNDWEGAQKLVISADADMCISSIRVFEVHPEPVHDAMLHWNTTDDLTKGVTLVLGATTQYEATAKGAGEITYESTDTEVATVSENGTIETIAAGTTTIKAMLAAEGCFGEDTIEYTLTVIDATLQQLIDATPAGETLTLTIDYTGQDGVIDKAITINGENKEVGTLTVTENGTLTVGSAIKMNEFTLWEAEGNASTSAKSAQIIGADNLNISGDTWFNVTFEPGANIDFGWYTMSVPFNVDNANGVYYLKNGVRTKATLDKDYSLHHYNSVTRAQGKKGWEKYSNTLKPGELYLIAMDNDLNVSTFCFKKTDGKLGGDAELALNVYPSSDPTNANWNGVGNSTLVYRNVSFSGNKVQVFNHADDAFQVYPVSEVSFVVGGAFFAQSEGEETLTLTEATDPAFLRTPARKRAVTMDELNIRIGKDENSYTDQIFLSAEDDALDSYEIAHDLVKMSYNTPKVAQMAINAYGVSLCDAELPWNASNEAIFPLTITAPKVGTYTIYLNGEAQSALLLYQNGHYVCDLTAGAYTMDLGKGKNSEYSLVMTRPNETVLTGNEDVQQALKVKKIILDNQMYILKDNQMINAIGTIVK